jgi:hypothetical protein
VLNTESGPASYVTLRQWADPATKEFPLYLNTGDVNLECIEAIGEPFSNEFYQQVILKAKTPNCRWKYTLYNAEDSDQWISFEFIVMPDVQPEH